ncbi:MAG: hypothetical protein L0154_20905 [Chloroflexi bacterium]|nr:hypothetical protein [Chloroflexota bacterium]
MNVISLEFLLFTGAFFALYYILPARLQNWILLAASFAFLGLWALTFAVVVGLLTLINYCIGRGITGKNTRSRWLLWSGVVLNILSLAYFRYNDFFVVEMGDFVDAIGLPFNTENLRFILPIGLSYFALQNISYLMDIINGVIEPERTLLHYALYMTYFPKTISGPIERAREFIPQLSIRRTLSNDNFSDGFVLLFQGTFRKIVLADVLLTIIPDNVFSEPHEFSSPELLVWLVAYAFALYNDFAGYTKFVRGISLFFGITLSRNFSTPYFSRNFSEFWQCWHISLSNWLRDYIFSPLTRALLRRKYKSRHAMSIIVPPLVTMLASALWHNIGLAMLMWGMLHGIYLIVERFRALYFRSKPPQQQPVWRQGIAMASVFVLAVFAWIPFRATSPEDALVYAARLFYMSGKFDWGFHLHIVFFATLAITLIMDVVEYHWGETIYRFLPVMAQAFLMSVTLIMMVLVLMARSDTPPPFIYQGF